MVDHDALQQRSSLTPWSALFKPSEDLPLRLILLALHRGYSINSPNALHTMSLALASQGPLHPELVHTALRRLTSWATTVDNFPPALLAGAEGGLVAGCQRIAAYHRAGAPTRVSIVTQYGSYKGPPKPEHLFESHRPLSVASPLASFEAAAAGQLIRATLELSGSATPELFAYRHEIQPPYMVFAMRAAIYVSLLTNGRAAVVKWDESHAYFRIPRAAAHDTLGLLPGTWNFASWFTYYYSSLSIRVLTDSGFTEPIHTEEGANQGCPAADQCFQGTQACLNTTLHTFTDITLPSPRGPLPCTRAGFSYDGIFIAPHLERAVHAADDCVSCSKALGRVPNPHELEFFLAEFRSPNVVMKRLAVPAYDTHTRPEPPTLVGIPLLPEVNVSATLAKLHPKFTRTVARVTAHRQANPVLRLRAFHAYAISSFDYVAHGALFPKASLTTLSVRTRRLYRRTYGLPKWAPVWFLHRPLPAGGAGCPDLYLRNVVQLMTTLLRASISRQPLARAGAQYLLHSDVPLSAVPELMRALAPVGLQLHQIPSPTLREATQHYTGTPRLPESLGAVYLAYDAAVQGNRLGVAAIAWHWTTGVLYTFQTALYAYRPSSSEAEWLARLLPLHPLQHWSGTVYFVTDSANTCTHRLTRGPCEQTLIAIYFRHAAAFHDGLKQRDLWLRAQHTTGLQDVLSRLNAEAHNLAQSALFRAIPHTVPLAAALQGTTVATIDGAVVLDPAAHMDDLYARATSRHPVPQLAGWDSAAWAEVCLTGSLPEHDVRRVMLLRLLALAPPPHQWAATPAPSVCWLCTTCQPTFVLIVHRLIWPH